MKQFDVINYVTYHWMACGVLLLATLKFETKLLECIRKGIITFKIFILGGILSDICAEITFYGSVTIKLNFQPYIRRYTSPNGNFENGYRLNIVQANTVASISLS